MSMAPDPGKILDVISLFDEDFQARPLFDSLLEQIIPRLPQAWPAITLARAYCHEANGLRLVIATDDRVGSTLESVDLFAKALAERRAIHNTRHSLWGLPLADSQHIFGLLVVQLDEDTPEGESWLRVLVTLISQALSHHTMIRTARDLTTQLVVASRLITAANSYDDLAQAAATTLGETMKGVAVTLFDQPLDAEQVPTSRSVAALAAADGPLEGIDRDYHDSLPDRMQLEALRQGQPLIVRDLRDSAFTLAAQQYQQAAPSEAIVWLAAFGLRAGDQLLGTLEVLHDGVQQFTSEQIDAFITLADQIGVSVRNRQLLEQSTASLEETRQLYELNRQMLAAQDTMEALRALRVLAPDTMLISHTTLEYNADGSLTDAVIRHILTPTVEQVREQSMAAEYGREAIRQVATLAQGISGPVMIDNLDEPPDGFPPFLLQQLKSQGISSGVAIPIQQQNRLSEVVRIGFVEPRAFDERDQRLYTAVQEQMSVVFQILHEVREAQYGSMSLGRQVAVLQTLNDLSTVISMAREESQLLSQTTQSLVTALNVDYCRIYLLDNTYQIGTIVSEFPSRNNIGNRTPPEDIPITALLDPRSPAPVIVNDIMSDWRLSEEAENSLRNQGIHACMLLPMFARGQMIGGIRLDIERPNRTFTSDTVDIAQTIVAQVEVGLQNIRLLSEARLRSEQLQRVSQFGQTLQSTLDQQVILETALTESHRIIPVEHMTIALYDPEARILRTAATYHNGENYLTPAQGTPLETQGTAIGHVWESQQLLHVADIMQDETALSGDDHELRALLIAPLVGHDRPLGIVHAAHSQPNVYNETDIIVFQQMVGLLAVAIENANVFARSQAQARNEALSNDIATRLQQQVDLDDMLQITANDLGRALGARRARIRLRTPSGEAEPANGASES